MMLNAELRIDEPQVRVTESDARTALHAVSGWLMRQSVLPSVI
jgi:hypothetical protein